MRTAGFLALVLLGPCNKLMGTGDDASSAAASAAPTGEATGAASAAGASATGTGATAAGTAAGAGATAKVVQPGKGVAVNADGGIAIWNEDGGKRLDFDGGQLTLKNDAGVGTITQTDAGVVLKGKDGKTLTLPPVPGLK